MSFTFAIKFIAEWRKKCYSKSSETMKTADYESP